jgi:HTH-type transcriptional regulator / antitoxin HigA
MIVTEKTKSVVRKVNPQKYADLLRSAQPTRISTEADYDRAIAFVDKLITKAKLSTEEEKILELMVTLIEVYETEHHPIPKAEPRSIIKMLMEDRGLEQKDLIPVLGSKSAVSQVLNGNRYPSKTQVKNLVEFFRVKPELFVSFAE